MRVCVGIRNRDGYPYRETLSGIAANGDDVVYGNVAKADALVTWNLYGTNKMLADKHEGLHVVMENGYFRNGKNYLIERGGFNGRGSVPDYVEDGGRRMREVFGVEIQPWKKSGNYILVCGQRGGTYNELAMPKDWPDEALMRLMLSTERPILYRPHPGRQCLPQYTYPNCTVADFEAPLAEYLKGAFAVVVWTSNSAVEALLEGVPVIYCGPSLSVAELCGTNLGDVDCPFYPDNREEVFARLAWHQHTADELKSGKAWARVRQWR